MDDSRADAPAEDVRVDVVLIPTGEVKAVPTGEGREVVATHEASMAHLDQLRRGMTWLLTLSLPLLTAWEVGRPLPALPVAVVVSVCARLVWWAFRRSPWGSPAPELVQGNVALDDARGQTDVTFDSASRAAATRARTNVEAAPVGYTGHD